MGWSGSCRLSGPGSRLPYQQVTPFPSCRTMLPPFAAPTPFSSERVQVLAIDFARHGVHAAAIQE
eukprot:4757518-Prorocentrum_lima.AAC.1